MTSPTMEELLTWLKEQIENLTWSRNHLVDGKDPSDAELCRHWDAEIAMLTALRRLVEPGPSVSMEQINDAIVASVNGRGEGYEFDEQTFADWLRSVGVEVREEEADRG